MAVAILDHQTWVRVVAVLALSSVAGLVVCKGAFVPCLRTAPDGIMGSLIFLNKFFCSLHHKKVVHVCTAGGLLGFC